MDEVNFKIRNNKRKLEIFNWIRIERPNCKKFNRSKEFGKLNSMQVIKHLISRNIEIKWRKLSKKHVKL